MFVTKHYLADPHFGHAKIIQACNRPFKDPCEMDEAMVAAWNSVVRSGDLTFIIGDFALNLGDTDRVREIFARLNGRKRLIMGNHDLRGGDLHPTLAGLEWDAAPAHAAETTDGGVRIYMHHYACRTWPGAHYGAAHFYGHSHGSLSGVGRSRDVGVDVDDVAFKPRTFAELSKEFPR